MYSIDFSGRHPTSMSALTPDYLKTIPSCLEAGEDTYSQSYRVAYAERAGQVWHFCAQPICQQEKARLNDLVATYADKHGPPTNLEEVLGQEGLPACADDVPYKYSKVFSDYTVMCQGLHHRSAGIETPDYPQYTSREGLFERP